MFYAIQPSKKVSEDDLKRVKEEMVKFQKDKSYIPILPFGWKVCEAGINWEPTEEE